MSAEVVDLKKWYKTQLDKVLDFIKVHTARKNGDKKETFKAKAATDVGDVTTLEQLKIDYPDGFQAEYDAARG